MSTTPRTDAVRIGPEHKHKYWEDFARELERENASLRALVEEAANWIDPKQGPPELLPGQMVKYLRAKLSGQKYP